MQSAVVFTLLTFVVSWLLWAGTAAIQNWDYSALTPLGGALYLLGVFAPALVALALTARAEGTAGVEAILRRMLMWSVGWRWYAFALGYFASVKAGVALLHRLAIGEWPVFSETPWFLMLAAIPFSTPVQAGEEVGWRGYLLPRLSSRLGLPVASLVVGVIWASWHLPFFLVAGADKSGQSFPAYLAGVIGLSVAMAWLYWRTHGSLLLTMLMHAAVNNTNFVPAPAVATADPFSLPSSFVVWSTIALLSVSAPFFLVAMRGQKDVTASYARRPER